ncbi:MAG: hypothetical protein H8E31_11520, partial [Planctomycetes bacterium]|nr:hypothetical protein [Planctomycetota bacterium]
GGPGGAAAPWAGGFAPGAFGRGTSRPFFGGAVGGGAGAAAGRGSAQLSYLATGWLTLGAGQFLCPFGQFSERYHPSWINRLPNAPLIAGHDGMVPTAMVGVQARGGVQVGGSRLNYALFLSNGPELNDGVADPDEAGLLHFDPGMDGDQNKSLGGRIGFLPVPGIEVGASVMSGKLSGGGTSQLTVDFNLLGLDLSAQQEVDALAGRVRFDAEFVRADVGDTRYLPVTPGSFTFSNQKSGGYGQLSYRATQVESSLLQDSEFVVRYDWLNLPTGAPEEDDHTRVTLGVDYWLTSSTVLKIAVDRLQVVGEPDSNNFYAQVAIGF